MNASSRVAMAGIVCAGLSLSACAKAPTGSEVNDPFEPVNRKVHQFNKSVDRTFLKPASQVYAQIVTAEDDKQINNFVSNLGTPSQAVNSLLQGDITHFLTSTLRFGLNSTLGFGGIVDAAQDFGLQETEADFGQTMHVWGFTEGRYIELPLLGGSTERDTVGKIVDMVLDPLGGVVSTDVGYGFSAMKGLELLGDRNTYSDLIDGVLYESPDSYASQRIYYLQNRRFFLNGEVQANDLEDPFSDE